MRLVHEFEPVFNGEARVLILGSFPSVRSREQKFYYGHPQNRFWKIISMVCGEDTPITVEEKRELLLSNKIALWDVVQSCEITGSSDSSIKNVIANDLGVILGSCDIAQIFTNGSTAYKLFVRYQRNNIGRDAVRLPSTSPANAAWSVDRLYGEWKAIKDIEN